MATNSIIPLRKVFKKIYKYLTNNEDSPIFALETGCSFLWKEEFHHNLSTLNIGKYLIEKHRNSCLYSLDVSGKNLNICEERVDEFGFFHKWIPVLDDSVQAMKSLAEETAEVFNFFWLDSLEDEEHGLEEYVQVKNLVSKDLTQGKYVICIDDYGSENSVKWKSSSKLLKKESVKYETFKTSTGLIVGYFQL